MRFSDLEKEMLNVAYDDAFRDPNFFVEKTTPYTPSEAQRKFLDYSKDLDNDRMIISSPRQTGKTMGLAFLATWSITEIPKITGQPYQVAVLGGKYSQAEILHEYCSSWFRSNPYLESRLNRDPVKGKIEIDDGSKLMALSASSKSVHGLSPDALFIDEAVDADEDIIKTAFQMISASEYPRIVLCSTPYEYFHLFSEYWEEADKYGYEKFHYTIEETPWISEEQKERAKQEQDEEIFQTEWIGLPVAKSSMVFEPDMVRPNIVEEGFEEIDGVRKILGVDFGFSVSPTALAVVQRVDNEWQVIHTELMEKPEPEAVTSRIKDLTHRHNLTRIKGDAENSSEIKRLRGEGLPIQAIGFSHKRESEMIPRVRSLLKSGELKIPEKYSELLKQMSKMQYKEVGGNITTKSKGIDLVDALVLALTTQEISTGGFTIASGDYG